MAVDLGIPNIEDATRIAAGGFAVVYRAHQRALGRDVAVKVIQDRGLDDRGRERFVRECRALGRVSDHRSIVPVFDAGITTDGSPYVVMQYVAGGSLEDRLRSSGPLPAADVIAVGNAVGSALQAAHDVGVLHLDIKPGNVLVDRFGNYLLTDFGIARLTDPGRDLTSYSIAGTPGFAAPEVIRGDPPTAAADIFGIGALLYTLAMGSAPFTMNDGEGLLPFLMRVAREPAPLLPDSAPAPLRTVVANAMASQPTDRYASCRDLQADLGGASTSGRVAPPPPPPPASLTRRADSPHQPAAPPTAPPPAPTVPPAPPPAPSRPTTAEPIGDRPVTVSGVFGRTSGRRRQRVVGWISLGVIGAAAAVVIALAAFGGGDGNPGAAQPNSTDSGGSARTTQTAAGLAPVAATNEPQPTDAGTTAFDRTESSVPAAPSTAASTAVAAAPALTAPALTAPGVTAPTGSRLTRLPLSAPEGVVAMADGSVLVADSANHLIRRVFPDGSNAIVAGGGQAGFWGDGGAATEAALDTPESAAVGPDGSIYISDWGNHRIRRVSPAGVITTIAGNGVEGPNGDGGPAIDAELNDPIQLAVGSDGSVYFADNRNHRVRRVGPDGTISTVAGTGAEGQGPAGGLAVATDLNQPQGVTVAPDGSLVFTDTYNHRVVRIGLDGTLTVLAGSGVAGFGGDGGPAQFAQLDRPVGVTFGPDGSVYVADYGNDRIRRISPDGSISTVAGSGGSGVNDGGLAIAAALDAPQGVAFRPDGSLVISESGANRLRVVTPDGVINTLMS